MNQIVDRLEREPSAAEYLNVATLIDSLIADRKAAAIEIDKMLAEIAELKAFKVEAHKLADDYLKLTADIHRVNDQLDAKDSTIAALKLQVALVERERNHAQASAFTAENKLTDIMNAKTLAMVSADYNDTDDRNSIRQEVPTGELPPVGTELIARPKRILSDDYGERNDVTG